MNYWVHVAHKDFQDAIRSKMLWGLSALMIAFACLGLYYPRMMSDNPSIEDGVLLLSTPIMILIPLISLVAGYMSIVGERDTGNIKLLLGLPIVRSEVVAGKFAGRSAVLAVPVLIGFAIGGLLAIPLYGSVPGASYLQMIVVSLLVALVYVALAVGVSASVASRGKAMALVIGFFALFEYLWSLIPSGIYYLMNGELPAGSAPDWMLLFLRFQPGSAIVLFVDALFDLFGAGETGLGNAVAQGLQAGSDAPFYLNEWLTGLIVLLWIAVPLAIGYYRFENATLG